MLQKGGLAVGPSHKNGGIPGIIKSSGDPIEFEGGEIIITKDASEKHCETLSKINQDGGGVPIPCDTQGNETRFESGGKTPYAPDYLQRIFDERMKVEKEKDRLSGQIAEAMARQEFGKAAIMRRKLDKLSHDFSCDADATAFEYYRHLCGIHSDVLVSHGEGFISYKYAGSETRFDGLNFKNTYEQGGKVSGWEMPSAEIYKYALKVKKNYPEIWKAGGNIYGNEAFLRLSEVIERGYWLKQEEPFYNKWQSFKARHAGNFRLAGVIANLKWLSWGEIGEKQAKQTIEDEY
jgi:hypothetical protein